MKIEIENLKALIRGIELTAYQRALAMNEWSNLQLYVNDLEKLNIPAERLEVIKDDENIVAFPEIHVSDEQLEIIAMPMFGFTKDELKEYYRNKIHGEILLIQSPHTTSEDQPDFQYLFDLGVKALTSGIVL